MEKSERLLDLIALLLEARRPKTAEEIRQEIGLYPSAKETFRRAFERDKADLRAMGVPLVTELPVHGDPNEPGYRIPPEEYYLRDPGLAPDELAALRLALDTVRLDGVDVQDGIRKLGGGGRTEGAPAAVTVPFNQHAPGVLEAISKHRQLEFDYPGSDGVLVHRRVDPLHLHTSRGRWHLHAHDHARGERRQFRLDRVRGPMVAGADGSAEVTELDDAVDTTLHGWLIGDAEPVAARVWIAAAQAPVAVREVGDAAEVEERPDGSVVLTLQVRKVSGLRSFVLGFLDDAEVLDPPELRDDMVSWLTAIAEGA